MTANKKMPDSVQVIQSYFNGGYFCSVVVGDGGTKYVREDLSMTTTPSPVGDVGPTVICETHGNSCTKEKQPDGSIMAYCSQCKGGDVGEALEKLVDLIVYHMDTEQTLGRAAMRSEGFPVGVLLPRESLKKNLLSDKEYGPVIETIRAALTGQAGEKG